MKNVAPSVKETAFNCPSCGTFTTQHWKSAYLENRDKNSLPYILDERFKENIQNDTELPEDQKRHWLNNIDKILAGKPALASKRSDIYGHHLHNVFASKCYNCGDLALWLGSSLIYPQKNNAPPPNADLSEKVLKYYNEAASIIHLSPRGAAALLRLCIEELCGEIGDPDKKINTNIQELVKNGLDIRIQKALDAVRVIGNDAVHGGQIDLDDDVAIANSLFGLINLIADKMITEPKHIDEIYNQLPQDKLDGIENRDKKPKTATDPT